MFSEEFSSYKDKKQLNKKSNISMDYRSFMDYNSINLDGLDTTRSLLYESTKTKLDSIREANNGITLSKEDFKEYFQGDLSQLNVGDCWLVATINSLKMSSRYEELIRKSVKKIANGFEITLPLGSPNGKGKKITVYKKDLYPQMSVSGEQLMPLNGKDGLKSLAIAYGKISTGKDEFDILSLTGGITSNALNTLVYGVNTYSDYRKIYKKDGKINNKPDIKYSKKIEYALSHFNEKRGDILLVSIPISMKGKINEMLDFRVGNNLKNAHAFSVLSVIKNNDKITSVVLINPWDSTKSFTVSFKDVKNLSLDYSLASNKKIKGLSKTVENDIGRERNLDTSDLSLQNLSMAEIIKRHYQNKFGDGNSMIKLVRNDYEIRYNLKSYYYSDTFVGTGFYQGITEEACKDIYKYIQQLNGNLGINNSDEKEVAAIVSRMLNGLGSFRNGKIDYTITFGNKTLNFGKENPFSDKFQGETNKMHKYLLYPALLSTAINKIRRDYINEDRGVPIVKPFFVDEEGNVGFNTWKISDFITMHKGNNTILSNWKELGIDQNDTETKEQIVNLLNQLYYSNNEVKKKDS